LLNRVRCASPPSAFGSEAVAAETGSNSAPVFSLASSSRFDAMARHLLGEAPLPLPAARDGQVVHQLDGPQRGRQRTRVRLCARCSRLTLRRLCELCRGKEPWRSPF